MIFEIITTLKSAGMSLKEILKYSSRQNSKEFLNLLKEKRYELMETRRRLADMQEFVENTIGIIETSLNVSLGEVYLKHCREEYLVIIETPSSDDMNDKSYWIRIKELTDFFRANKAGQRFSHWRNRSEGEL
jgi:hypothetical protein